MSSEQSHPRRTSALRQTPVRALRVAHLILVLAEHDAVGLGFEDLLLHPRLRTSFGPTPDAARQMLREDLTLLARQPLRRLRTRTPAPEDALIRVDPVTQRYHLAQPIPVLALDAAALEALGALLVALHDGAVVPGGRDLVAQVLRLLPEADRVRLTEVPATPRLALDAGLVALASPTEQLAQHLLRAQRMRHTIAFQYQPLNQAAPTRHSGDEVLGVWIGAHPYATVWCARGGVELDLRLERFVPGTLELLPTLANPRPRQGVLVHYLLAPRLAESGDTPHLTQQHTTTHPDGSVEVSGYARNLFWAHKLLLGYGAHARALAPPELVAMMQKSIAAMAARYNETAPPEGGADEKDGPIP